MRLYDSFLLSMCFGMNALARVAVEQIGKIQRITKDLLPLEADFLAPTVIIQLAPLI